MNSMLQESESQYTLYHGDCLEVMQDLPTSSVDCILTDLPYAKTQNHWDAIIPFEPMWKGYKHVTKTNGAIVLFSAQPFTSMLVMSNLPMFRYETIWEKSKAGGFLNARRMPLMSHENVCIFYSSLPTYNPQMQEGKPYTKKAVTDGDGKNYGKFSRVGSTNVNEGTRFPRSVVREPNDNHKSLHPTQKPVSLLEYLIKTYTNEGDVVLDSCFGSCSTGIACLNTGRKFIGIEKDDKYFALGSERMRNHDATR